MKFCPLLAHPLPPPHPIKNRRKLKEKPHYPRWEEVTTGIEKNPDKETPAIVFFCGVSNLIQLGYMKSCLAAQKRFLLFKGPGSFNKIV